MAIRRLWKRSCGCYVYNDSGLLYGINPSTNTQTKPSRTELEALEKLVSICGHF